MVRMEGPEMDEVKADHGGAWFRGVQASLESDPEKGEVDERN